MVRYRTFKPSGARHVPAHAAHEAALSRGALRTVLVRGVPVCCRRFFDGPELRPRLEVGRLCFFELFSNFWRIFGKL